MRHVVMAGMFCSCVSANLWAGLDNDITLNIQGHVDGASPDLSDAGGKWHSRYTFDAEALSLVAEGRVIWNEAYRSAEYSREAREDYRYSADWRELYVSHQFGDWQLSGGLQQIVWGKADNLRVVDIVNPVDLRNFVVPDLNEYRVALPMVRLQVMMSNWTLESFYIPTFTPTAFAKQGSEYFLAASAIESAPGLQVLPEDRTGNGGEWGASASSSWGALDVSLYLFHTRDDNPVYSQSLATDANGNFLIDLQPEYRRQWMTGLSLAKTLPRGFVLRSELAYYPDYAYSLQSLDLARGGVRKSPTANVLVGLDYLWRDWLIALQANDRRIAFWEPEYFVPEHDLLYTLSATGSSFAGKLDTRISLARFDRAANGGLYQLMLTWKPDDHWSWFAGADIFSGEDTGTFGQFDAKDSIKTGAKYQF